MNEGEVTVALRRLPPSLNKGTRGRGIAAHREKKAIEEELVWALLEGKVPKGLSHAQATATLRFPTRHRRDPDNYGWLLGKALGDALAPHDPRAPHRWLPDDTADFYSWVQPVRFDPEVGAPLTLVHLTWRRP